MARKSRKRDYKAEYQRRIQRALEGGYSKSVARGHPRKREIGLKRAKQIAEQIPDFKPVVIGRNGHARKGFRHTPESRKKEMEERGIKIDTDFRDKGQEKFIEDVLAAGFTEREAYTLFFS